MSNSWLFTDPLLKTEIHLTWAINIWNNPFPRFSFSAKDCLVWLSPSICEWYTWRLIGSLSPMSWWWISSDVTHLHEAKAAVGIKWPVFTTKFVQMLTYKEGDVELLLSWFIRSCHDKRSISYKKKIISWIHYIQKYLLKLFLNPWK